MTAGREIALAREGQLEAIARVMTAARAIMRADGNHRQWVGGYPSREAILRDIAADAGYVVTDEGEVVAYFAFVPSPEPTYDRIDGAWLDDERPYHVIHRLGSYAHVHGIFADVIDYCATRERNLRIDTHSDNSIMRHNIERHGFTYCGVIYLADGSPRLAYQRLD